MWETVVDRVPFRSTPRVSLPSKAGQHSHPVWRSMLWRASIRPVRSLQLTRLNWEQAAELLICRFINRWTWHATVSPRNAAVAFVQCDLWLYVL